MSNNLPSIHDLRKAGHKIRISHYRYILVPVTSCLTRVTKKDKKGGVYPTNSILAKGGRTEIEFTPKDGSTTQVVESCCNPKDQFNRRLGIRICLGRLRKNGVI